MKPEVIKALRDLERSIKRARKVITAEHQDEAFTNAAVLAFVIFRIPQKDGQRFEAIADAVRLWITTGGAMVTL